MNNIVYIPNIPHSNRIGSIFNYLYRIMQETESVSGRCVVWDFTYCSFLHSSILAPLAMFKVKSRKDIVLSNLSHDISRYLTAIHFQNFINIDAPYVLQQILNEYNTTNYIPLCRFLRTNHNLDEIQTIIEKVILQQIKHQNLRTPLSYLFSELVGNIIEHSECEYGCIFSQYYVYNKTLEICIIDDGITIYGSYIKTMRNTVDMTSEAVAIKKAVSGYSSKNLPNAENRGYGLETTMKMIVDGLGGAFFILSGGAFFRYMNNQKEYVDLPKEYIYSGTAILLRIPMDIPHNFNYINYIQ